MGGDVNLDGCGRCLRMEMKWWASKEDEIGDKARGRCRRSLLLEGMRSD